MGERYLAGRFRISEKARPVWDGLQKTWAGNSAWVDAAAFEAAGLRYSGGDPWTPALVNLRSERRVGLSAAEL